MYGEGGREATFVVLSPFQNAVQTTEYERGNETFEKMEEHIRKMYGNEKLVLKSLKAEHMVENKGEIQ